MRGEHQREQREHGDRPGDHAEGGDARERRDLLGHLGLRELDLGAHEPRRVLGEARHEAAETIGGRHRRSSLPGSPELNRSASLQRLPLAASARRAPAGCRAARGPSRRAARGRPAPRAPAAAPRGRPAASRSRRCAVSISRMRFAVRLSGGRLRRRLRLLRASARVRCSSRPAPAALRGAAAAAAA